MMGIYTERIRDGEAVQGLGWDGWTLALCAALCEGEKGFVFWCDDDVFANLQTSCMGAWLFYLFLQRCRWDHYYICDEHVAA